MKFTSKVAAFIAALLFAGLAAAPASAGEEGGYVYNHGEARFQANVYNFIRHFNYDQYLWCQSYMFNTSNTNYVDNMDFAYYSGHGNNWYMGMGPGASTSGVSINSSCKWGNTDLEFIVFQSCKVVPSPMDRFDWYARWVGGTNGVFQGLHQAIGYRTNSNSGNGISNNYGSRISSGQCVWQAWFNAVDDERAWWYGSTYPGFASVVLYPGLDYDTYYSFGVDPPDNHSSLRSYYQY
ncbi:MAG: hypothetical protein ACI9F9_000777 [Candidatus Paceibacteria bacterium]|jgi:hypothetical protein